jgi:hypothetical protein
VLVPPRVDWTGLRRLPHHERVAAVATGLGRALVDLSLADGPARFYEREFAAGKTLVLVIADARWLQAEAVLHRYGAEDLEQVGGELARAPELEAGAPASDVASVDSGLTWPEVANHYETLFDQRYGATSASWSEYQPACRFAWELANRPEHRGQNWSHAVDEVRRAWIRSGSRLPWQEVEDGMGDVWQEVIDDPAVYPDTHAAAA